MKLTTKILIISSVLLTTNSFSQEINQELVKRENFSHQKRIEILQERDKCITNAQTKEDYKECEKVEGESRKKYKKESQRLKLKRIKSEILEKINNRLEKIKENKNCVERRTNHEELKSCRKKD